MVLLGHLVDFFLVLKRLFSIMVVSVYIPTNSVGKFSFLQSSPAFTACRSFDDAHSEWCELIPHCSFDLHFSHY